MVFSPHVPLQNNFLSCQGMQKYSAKAPCNAVQDLSFDIIKEKVRNSKKKLLYKSFKKNFLSRMYVCTMYVHNV